MAKKKKNKLAPKGRCTALKKERERVNQDVFLAAFAVCGRIMVSQRVCKFSHGTHFRWMKDDPSYPKRFKEAQEEAKTILMDEAVHRAVDGQRSYKFCNGEPIMFKDPETGDIVHYYEDARSDTILITLLKGFYSDLFGGKVEHEHKGKLDVVHMNEEQYDAQCAKIISRATETPPANSRAIVEVSNQRLPGANGTGR